MARREQDRYLDLLRAGRPRTRADCAEGPRPCPWYSCRYHLGIDVDERGTIFANRGDRARRSTTIARVRRVRDLDAHLDAIVEWSQTHPTCALDVVDANPDGVERSEIAAYYGVTLERIRQLEHEGRDHLEIALRATGVTARVDIANDDSEVNVEPQLLLWPRSTWDAWRTDPVSRTRRRRRRTPAWAQLLLWPEEYIHAQAA